MYILIGLVYTTPKTKSDPIFFGYPKMDSIRSNKSINSKKLDWIDWFGWFGFDLAHPDR